ncbi:MAG TPA: histidinol phosphate phosphatase [Treponema sp.]|nr:histidinol phosphate phosphatase [Treponema sp.]
MGKIFTDDGIKTNYHMHTRYCDGSADVAQMAQAAFDCGMKDIGFSAHAMLPFSSDWHMNIRDYENYCKDVQDMKVQFEGKMNVRCGFEADFIPDVTSPTFEAYKKYKPDFIIASVHYVRIGNGYFEADGSFDDTRKRIVQYAKGNEKKAVQAYFDAQRQMLKKADFTFIGHCDLIRKQNSSLAPQKLFDESASWYRKEIQLTAKAIASAGVCVEINTGAMSRGYLDTPYPSLPFLELLHQYSVPVTFASDAHRKEHIDFAFDQACLLAKKAGYTELHYLSSEGKLVAQKI